MPGVGELAGHPDRERWNTRYEGRHPVSFEPHPAAVRALSLGLPDGPVADLACGLGGSALLAAAAGHRVTAVDISDVALGMLAEEASRRGLGELITVVQTDLGAWRPEPGGYALVLCTGFWERAAFATAAGAVAAGGVLGWEAFTVEARRARPGWSPVSPRRCCPPDSRFSTSVTCPGAPKGPCSSGSGAEDAGYWPAWLTTTDKSWVSTRR
jgi:SAM-dependent methyltransferase